MNNLDYPVVTPDEPTLVVFVEGVDLASIVSVGETALYIRRVGEFAEYAKYYPFETKQNQFLFTFDSALFDKLSGRYEGRLVYNGTTIASIVFVSKVPKVKLVGSTNV